VALSVDRLCMIYLYYTLTVNLDIHEIKAAEVIRFSVVCQSFIFIRVELLVL